MVKARRRIGIGIILLIVAGFVFQDRNDWSNRDKTGYRLLVPIELVAAQETDTNIGDILEREAGMSAYFQVPSGIELESVKAVFRTTEVETEGYIIGSVPVNDYNDPLEDVHVFVSSTGWIVAYYLASDPASKIIDVVHTSSGSTTIDTKLELVLRTVTAAASVGYQQPSFYDYRYPEATQLLIATGNGFEVELPSTFRYYERSLARRDPSLTCHNFFAIDRQRPSSTFLGTRDGQYVIVEPSLLSPDMSHTIDRGDDDCTLPFLLLVYGAD